MAHIEGFTWAEITERGADIGGGVQVWWVIAGDEDGAPIMGVIEWHRDAQGRACGGYVGWAQSTFALAHPDRLSEAERKEPRWKLEVARDASLPLTSAGQLTLSPSVACKACGHHGYIRGGRWV